MKYFFNKIKKLIKKTILKFRTNRKFQFLIKLGRPSKKKFFIRIWTPIWHEK
jgi:hypothetical protein